MTSLGFTLFILLVVVSLPGFYFFWRENQVLRSTLVMVRDATGGEIKGGLITHPSLCFLIDQCQARIGSGIGSSGIDDVGSNNYTFCELDLDHDLGQSFIYCFNKIQYEKENNLSPEIKQLIDRNFLQKLSPVIGKPNAELRLLTVNNKSRFSIRFDEVTTSYEIYFCLVEAMKKLCENCISIQ